MKEKTRKEKNNPILTNQNFLKKHNKIIFLLITFFLLPFSIYSFWRVFWDFTTKRSVVHINILSEKEGSVYKYMHTDYLADEVDVMYT